MKITPTSLTVSQLLSSENEQYVIPPYQRRFSWTKNQVVDLWDDLHLLEESDSHLLGTIVCLAGDHRAGVNQLDVVDGQQRLTTISILLHCLVGRLQQLGDTEQVQNLMRLLRASAPDGATHPKILLDSLDAKQFKKHVEGTWDEPENPRLLEAFQLMHERLNGLAPKDVQGLSFRLRNQAVVIRLDVSHAKDAFKLFETINNRGLQLSPADIIKNFILGNAARFGAPSLQLARERWADILRALDGITLDTFFRQFMMAHLARRVSLNDVVDEFQKAFMHGVVEAEALPERKHYSQPELVDDDEDVVVAGTRPQADEEDVVDRGGQPHHRIPFEEFLARLVARAKIYRELVLASSGKPAIDRRLRNLRLIRSRPSYGFLMHLRASGCDDGQFEQVLRLTESFMLRRHTTRERTSENERVFAELCSADTQHPVPAVQARFRRDYPSDERFRHEFKTATYPSGIVDRARYCLEQIEIHLQGPQPELLPGGPDLVHIEHIIPQKIKTKRAKADYGDWETYLGPSASDKHPAFVSRIGNLTLFSGKLNIVASNNPYQRKRDSHNQSAFSLTKELHTKYPEFRFDEVESRSEYLAELAVKMWPAI